MLRVAEEFHGSHTGRQRPANEDSLYARAPLFAVADGMGGAQAGEIASSIAVETLRAGDAGDGSAEDRLATLVLTANERIHELSRSDERHAGMGTTMTVVLLGEQDVTIAHVGDSRLYLLREGELRRLTRDHSLVEELLEQGKLTPEEASRHPQRSVITRAVGPEAHVEVDTLTAPARDGDVYLLCSDGLTTMVDEADIERALREHASLPDAGHALIDAANEAGGRDNITVVLFRVADVGAAGGGSPAAAEQPTSAGGDETLRTADVQAAVEAEGRRETARPLATLDRPRPDKPPTRRLEPIVPSAPPADGSRRRRPRLRKALIVLSILGFVGVPIALGGLIALRSVFFIGTNEQGFVTVFRGLPYDLPLGIELYQENFESGVHRDQVAPARRTSLLDQSLRSQEDAYDLVASLEKGQLR